MKIRCPNCQKKIKIKSLEELLRNEHYHCQHCSRHLYTESSLWLGSFLASVFSDGLGFIVFLAGYFLTGFSLPEGLTHGKQLVFSLIGGFVLGLLYLKVIEIIRHAVIKVKIANEVQMP